MKPLHTCSVASCPTLVRNGPRCPAHTITREQRNPKDPRQAQFYGSTRWKKLRAMVKARDPICKICRRKPTQEADHIDDNWENNDYDNNLQGVCSDCHATKSGRQHYWRRVPVKLPPFVILVGLAGVGKSTVRKHLAPMLNATALGPDDHDGEWKEVYSILDRSPKAIVECCLIPGALSRRASKRGAYIVELTLPNPIRRTRLDKRKYGPENIDKLMAESRRLGYEQEVRANLTLDASTDPKQIAQRITRELSRAGGQ